MADVFISYRRSDRPTAEALYRALKEEGLDIWWDGGLQAGETFDEKIQSVLQAAKAVVLLWSPEAVDSDWVRGEGAIGRERGILVPIMVKPVNIPVPFNLIHTADLCNWNGDRSDPTYQGVVKRIKELAAKQHVKPLKPPPNRAMRDVWTAISAIAVISIGGASLWFFKPWEAIQTAMDPAVQAQKARDANIVKLAAFGIQPGDLEKFDWKRVAQKRFDQDKFDALQAEAESGNGPARAVLCAVLYWGSPSRQSDEAAAFTQCRLSAEAGEPAGQVYYATMLGDRAFLTNDPEQKSAHEAAATTELKKASDSGFGWGQLQYGGRMLYGTGGVSRDPQQAIELYKLAQAQGIAAADFALGEVAMAGIATGEPDRVEGVRLIKSAADKGYARAIYELADLYLRGVGVPQDRDEALRLYEAAATQIDSEQIASRAKGQINYIRDQINREKAEAAATPPAETPPAAPN